MQMLEPVFCASARITAARYFGLAPRSLGAAVVSFTRHGFGGRSGVSVMGGFGEAARHFRRTVQLAEAALAVSKDVNQARSPMTGAKDARCVSRACSMAVTVFTSFDASRIGRNAADRWRSHRFGL